MLQSIRDEMPTGAALTTECNSEPFSHVLDGYLSWTWQYDGQVPAFCAVYGGAIQVFGRQYGGNQQAKRMKCAQQLVFGEQLGWLAPDVIEENELTTQFLFDSARLRWKLRRYFREGEMARPPVLKGLIPQTTENWAWGGSKDWYVTTDSVLCGAWAMPGRGKLVLLFVNVSEEAIFAEYDFGASDYSLSGESLVRRRITANDRGDDDVVRSDFAEKIRFEPLTPWAWEFEVEPPSQTNGG